MPRPTVAAPSTQAATSRKKSSGDSIRGRSSRRRRRNAPVTSASAAFATPNSTESSSVRPALRLASPLESAMPTASAGHHDRGLSTRSTTETPAAGHQVATALLSGAK